MASLHRYVPIASGDDTLFARARTRLPTLIARPRRRPVLPIAPATHSLAPPPPKNNPKTEHKPWDVPAGTEVPMFDYHEADEVLGKSTVAHKTGQTVVPPPPPPPPRD